MRQLVFSHTAHQFGRPIPIVIHDLEYSWYTLEATRKTNFRQEADLFFAAMKRLGIME